VPPLAQNEYEHVLLALELLSIYFNQLLSLFSYCCCCGDGERERKIIKIYAEFEWKKHRRNVLNYVIWIFSLFLRSHETHFSRMLRYMLEEVLITFHVSCDNSVVERMMMEMTVTGESRNSILINLLFSPNKRYFFMNYKFFEIASCTHFRSCIRIVYPSISKPPRTHIEFASERAKRMCACQYDCVGEWCSVRILFQISHSR
jgi:hypothetical protein